MAIASSTVTPTGFKGEVEQVVQAYLFRSSILSRAKLGPACLGYLEIRTRERGDVNYKTTNLMYFFMHSF